MKRLNGVDDGELIVPRKRCRDGEKEGGEQPRFT